MGTGGEASILDGAGGTGDPRPFAYFAMDVAEPVPNIGLNNNKSLSDAAIEYDAESLTLDPSGAVNSAGSLRFNAGGEQLQNYSALRVNLEQYSVAAWIKPDIPANDLLTATSIFQHYNNPNGMILGVLPGGGLLYSYHRAAADGDGATALGGAIVNGQRDFIVGTVHRLNGRVRFYRNGSLAQESPMTVGTLKTAGSSTQRIGRGAQTKFGQPGFSTAQTFGNYTGLMAHLMLWRDHELSPAGVAALYAAGAGPIGATLTLTGVALGSDVVIKDPAITHDGTANTVVASFADVASTSVDWTYSRGVPPVVDVEIFRAGFKMAAIRGLATGADASIPVSQRPDSAFA